MSTPLNNAVVVGQATKSSDRTGAPDTRLRGRRLIFARVVWVAVVSLLVAAFLAMLPAYYTLLQTVCTSARCGLVQPTPGSALAIQKLGFSVSTYATIILALALAVAIVCFAVSTVIFWRKSDDWMALLVALGVVGLGTVNVAGVLLVSHSPWQVPAIVLGLLGLGMVFLVGSLFPNGRFVPRWTRWLLFCWLVTGIVYLFFRDVSFMNQIYNLAALAALVLVSIALFYRYHFASSPASADQVGHLRYLCGKYHRRRIKNANVSLPFVGASWLVLSADESACQYCSRAYRPDLLRPCYSALPAVGH